jgi:hypothetical protein
MNILIQRRGGTNLELQTSITIKVDCFNDIIDWQLQELDSRFNEISSQLLVCSASFSPRDSFHDFNVDKLLSLAKLYPHDFDSGDLTLAMNLASTYLM